MKCFDVVKAVLDATYEEIPGDKKTRDSRILKSLEDMSDRYNTRLMEEGGPDFNDPITRFGYVLRYVPAHAHWLYELLAECPQAIEILRSGKARIACLGGGPGSDLVGILKLLDEKKLKCKLFCELFDGCEGWKVTWSDLAYLLDLNGVFHTDYVIHDVAKKATWSSPSKIAKADIVTISFFVSEIFHINTSKDYLTQMLGQVKPGALVVMNDNRTKDVYQMMDRIAAETGFKTLSSTSGRKKIFDRGEDMSMLKKYVDKFGGSKLTGNTTSSVYQKQ